MFVNDPLGTSPFPVLPAGVFGEENLIQPSAGHPRPRAEGGLGAVGLGIGAPWWVELFHTFWSEGHAG